MPDQTITVSLKQQRDYQFAVEFSGDVPDLLADEPVPLGAGLGPSPVQLLAAAVGNCLSDSLLFALRKYKQSAEPLSCEIAAHVGRNDQGRTRVLSIDARLRIGVAAGTLQHLDRVLDQFEEFCTVTQSVRSGIAVSVHVSDANGTVLK
jgi:uncharacterized OsmC-like protein